MDKKEKTEKIDNQQKDKKAQNLDNKQNGIQEDTDGYIGNRNNVVRIKFNIVGCSFGIIIGLILCFFLTYVIDKSLPLFIVFVIMGSLLIIVDSIGVAYYVKRLENHIKTNNSSNKKLESKKKKEVKEEVSASKSK